MSSGYVSEKFDAGRFHDEIEKIVGILQKVKETIDDQTDVGWTSFRSSAAILNYIDKHIEQLGAGDRDELGWLSIMFGPTCEFEELAVSNGWGEKFLKLAEQVDFYVAKISRALPRLQIIERPYKILKFIAVDFSQRNNNKQIRGL